MKRRESIVVDGVKYVSTSKKKPIRHQIIRTDSSIGSAERTIAREYGLPKGSVHLMLPGGRRKAKSNKSIGALLKDYGI